MVHKTSHRGVHSGNTLRAFNSRFSRRYHNQACIVSRVRPELLKKLVSGGRNETEKIPLADDKSPQLNNVAVDVALSLNKQSRWLLPSALIRQIRSNDVAQSDLTVSLLERHKLKRPASCVSFHSNKGELKRIQPRNGRYFSFNFPTADGKSRRAYRRERREELLEQRRNGTSRKAEKIVGPMVEVYTELGQAKRDMNIGESEVRYEVYYPSSAHSSISHNPKYIKQDLDEGEHGRPKKQHRAKQRKRMSLKDLDDCDLPSYHYLDDLPTHRQAQDDLPSYYARDRQSFDSAKNDLHSYHAHDDLPSYLAQELALVSEGEEVTEAGENAVEHKTTDCLLSSLIDKAERLQHMVGVAKTRRRKKSGNKNGGRHYEDDKSHIVYLSQEQNVDEDDFEAEASPRAVPLALPAACPASTDSTRVLLPTEDVAAASLKDCFGQSYHEAACRPRKFLLDITANVREMLKKRGVQPRVADRTEDALTYLIFTHDGFYDDEHDVYKVMLNNRLRPGLLPVKVTVDDSQDLYRGTVIGLVSCAVDFAEGFVEELQEQNHFPTFLDRAELKAAHRELQHHLGATEIYQPSLERIFQLGSGVTDFVLPSLSDMLQEEPAFCDVCYDDVSPLTQDSAAATALLKCQHRVCDSCWSQHIHSRLHQGFVRVTCPGYDCQEEVKVGVLLSVAPLGTVEKVLQRQEEVRIGASLTEKWCPNQSCGRVLHLHPQPTSAPESDTSNLQQDVVCACGAHVCFQCLSPAHWPASCAQAEDYRNKLATTVFPDREAEVYDDSLVAEQARQKREAEAKKVMMVEGKHCPSCKNFVYKNGGCPQMTCRCGQLFCWFCGKPGFSHPNRGPGCLDIDQEKKLTTTIVVRHLDFSANEKEEKQKVAVQRQKVSLMERAAEHRQRRLNGQHSKVVAAMAKAVATAASKDKTLAQHIVNVCTNTFPSSSFSSSTSSTSDPTALTTPSVHQKAPRVMDTVTTFLKRAARSKQELYEVAEYSLVLLKDLPDSLPRRRALRISEDLGAFCTFTQSIFEGWGASTTGQGQGQEGVKAVMRLAEIQGWINSALASHVTTVKKLRASSLDKQ